MQNVTVLLDRVVAERGCLFYRNWSQNGMFFEKWRKSQKGAERRRTGENGGEYTRKPQEHGKKGSISKENTLTHRVDGSKGAGVLSGPGRCRGDRDGTGCENDNCRFAFLSIAAPRPGK